MVELGLKSQQRTTAALAAGMHIQGGKGYAVHTQVQVDSEDFIYIKQHS